MMAQKREKRLVWEWINKFHLTALKWRDARVGKIPEGQNPELYASLRKYVDAIFFEDNVVNIVEAKIVPKADAIMQILDYTKRFAETPDFEQYKDKQIRMIYLAAIEDPYIKDLCSEYNIEFIVWTPEWIKPYLREQGWKI